MATGRHVQLTRQIGEHLVTAELGRRGYVASPFAGNVPDWDVVAVDDRGRVVPIQVKTIQPGSSWQFTITKYLDVEMTMSGQIVRGLKDLAHPNLLCIYLELDQDRNDSFYLFTMSQFQAVAKAHYIPRLPPKKLESLHCAVGPRQLSKFKNQWNVLSMAFSQAPVTQPISE